MVTSRRRDLDRALKQFSLDQMPNSDRQALGRQRVNELFEYLRQNSSYRIDRQYIGGSSGKKTAADDTPDFDLVVFVNKEEPPFKLTVIAHFESLLRNSGLSKLEVRKTTPFSLQIKFDNVDIDLLPATNHVNNVGGQKPKIKILAAKQAHHVLREIEKTPNSYYQYSSALAETQLEFVRVQAAFVHELIRLCKFWSKKIKFEREVSGRSVMMELIAIKVCQLNPGCTDLLDVFLEFLKLCANFSNLSIQFPDFDPLESIRHEIGNWRPKVDKSVTTKKPHVIEPANPFNNIASWMDVRQISQFEKGAKETLARLEAWDSSQSVESIFEQPEAPNGGSRCSIM